MSNRVKAIAALLRSVADLLEAPLEKQEQATNGGRTVSTRNIDRLVEEIDAIEPPPMDVGKLKLERFDGATAAEMSGQRKCGVCMNGKRGRHIKECPRARGGVVERPAAQEPAGEAGSGEDGPDDPEEPNPVLERIKAGEVRHQCCGSRGPMHKRACPGITPQPPGAEDGEEADPDLKEFTCDDCGDTFMADPNEPRCKCGSNNIWPAYK